MHMFRFVHAADLHLDSPFTGIRHTHPDVGEILRQATFVAYENLIKLCINREVGALLVAGDVFDSADHSLVGQNPQRRFTDALGFHLGHVVPGSVCPWS